MVFIFTSVAIAFLLASAQARTTITMDNSSTMIVGGTAARQGQFPYQLELLINSFHLCGASLVQFNGFQVAITAAHCIAVRNPEMYTLIAGELDRNQTSGLEQSRNISRIVHHPNYAENSILLKNDIAIFFLSEPFELNDNVKPVSLPEKFEEVTSGTNITVSGWGSPSYEEDFVNLLQYVEIPVVSYEHCNASWSQDIPDWPSIAESQFCAGESRGIASPCRGDSGGPAISENSYLAGIVSWGKDCTDTDTHPAVFTKVSHFVDWIEVTIRSYQNNKS